MAPQQHKGKRREFTLRVPQDVWIALEGELIGSNLSRNELVCNLLAAQLDLPAVSTRAELLNGKQRRERGLPDPAGQMADGARAFYADGQPKPSNGVQAESDDRKANP